MGSANMRNQVKTVFSSIMDEIGSPGIHLVTQAEFKRITGRGLNRYWGRANVEHRVITVRNNLTHEQAVNIIWHEIAHLLYPKKPHWWIECYAAVMSRNESVMRFARRYRHDPSELPGRYCLLEITRVAVRKYNKIFSGN